MILKIVSTLILLSGGLALFAGDGRIPIASGPYTISAPGVYYLTQDLTLASGSNITVSASNVTVDLAGHTLRNTSGDMIFIGGTAVNVRVTNGRLLGGQRAVYITQGVADAYYQLDHLSISGQSFSGIHINPSAVSIYARVVIEDNELTAISGVGMQLNFIENGRIERNLVSHCITGVNNGTGINLSNGNYNRISHNVITGNAYNGIYLFGANHNTLDWNTVVGNGNYGFHFPTGGNNIYSNNRLSGNTNGNVFTGGVSAGGNNAGAANF